MGTIETVELFQLSLERAETIVPAEYIPAYRWFVEHEGETFKTFPTDVGVGIKIGAQRGIHKPGGMDFALSIKSMGNDFYTDDVIEQDDGTWIFNYSEQRKNEGSLKTTDIYNESLRRCLREGLPVAVYVKHAGRDALYDLKGLAFVEAYDAASGIFRLHGPVRYGQASDFWSVVPEADMPAEDRELLAQIDEADERRVKLIQHVQRVRQDQFRAELLRAYDDHCAMSGYGVPTALQAAHISSYRGPKSQCVTNGLLLRADLHLLYDNYLISVEPDSHQIFVSPKIESSEYGTLAKTHQRLTMPALKKDWPSEQRLAAHYAEFKLKNAC